MKSQFILSMIVAGMLMAAAADAQENTTNSSAPDEIFNSIMQTMPVEMKARVDSASAVQRSQKGTTATNAPLLDGKRGAQTAVDAKQASLDKLPEAVRDQVRKTMQELEKENSERMLQFKEAQNRKNIK